MSDPLTTIRSAQRNVEQAQTRLQDAVLSARASGTTWAQIGTTLGMTRQAAFKRFGKPKDPKTGGTMKTQPIAVVQELTETFLRHVAAGDQEAAMAMLHPDTRNELPWEQIISVWRGAVGERGELEGFTDTRVTAPGEGRDAALADDAELLGIAVGVTTIDHEAGETQARVGFDTEGRIVGVLYLPVDATEFPF